ncbi:mRNA cap guanine-N7 methyltransferase [Nosema granulosis]|uniref:mRNA cap guanine-N(7) methyltransferase n=1 Tax=Nosema granulosis TaxID=83296 RepID=A0A9P6KZQ8_9MICR|nr:mRNA cap guanine-N7 methyltransferase [Nosema granulosis]
MHNPKLDIKEHYNRIKKTPKERIQSKVANIRYTNNFIKAVLIRSYVRPHMLVLDIGCGKGGDLKKFDKAGILEYYGLDIAELSIYDARIRHNNMNNCYRAFFDTADVYAENFELNKEFDIVSCQFSLHYAFQSPEHVKNTVININRHLKAGGYFFFTVPNREEILKRYEENNLENKYYKIRYTGGQEYFFTLQDCVEDCVEYFVDLDVLSEMFLNYNIKIVRREKFEVFLEHNLKKYSDLANNMRVRELNKEEEEVISLYEIVVYKKIN